MLTGAFALVVLYIEQQPLDVLLFQQFPESYFVIAQLKGNQQVSVQAAVQLAQFVRAVLYNALLSFTCLLLCFSSLQFFLMLESPAVEWVLQ